MCRELYYYFIILCLEDILKCISILNFWPQNINNRLLLSQIMTENKYLVENFAKIFTLNSKRILLVACTIVILACDDLITKTANRLYNYR